MSLIFKAPFTLPEGHRKNSAIIAAVTTDQLYILDIDSICVVSSVEATVSLAGIFEGVLLQKLLV
jgi:hypothetical protein